MKSYISSIVLVALAALTNAQGPVYNNATGHFDCAIPDGVYCAGGNIIIRCIGLVGYPGNCNDNLDGEFPQGLNPTLCYTSPTTPGVAACSKNCVVYGGSGNINGTFPIPGCTPYAASTSSVTAPTGTVIYTTITTDYYTTVCPSSTVFSQGNKTYTVSSSTTLTITDCPCTLTTTANIQSTTATVALTTTAPTSTTPIFTISVGPTGFSVVSSSSATAAGNGNGTIPTTSGSATATPVGPTKSTFTTGPATFTGAASANSAGVAFAGIGLLAAYLL